MSIQTTLIRKQGEAMAAYIAAQAERRAAGLHASIAGAGMTRPAADELSRVNTALRHLRVFRGCMVSARHCREDMRRYGDPDGTSRRAVEHSLAVAREALAHVKSALAA